MNEVMKLVPSSELVTLEHAKQKLQQAEAKYNEACKLTRTVANKLRGMDIFHSKFDEVATLAGVANTELAQTGADLTYWREAVEDMELRTAKRKAIRQG